MSPYKSRAINFQCVLQILITIMILGTASGMAQTGNAHDLAIRSEPSILPALANAPSQCPISKNSPNQEDDHLITPFNSAFDDILKSHVETLFGEFGKQLLKNEVVTHETIVPDRFALAEMCEVPVLGGKTKVFERNQSGCSSSNYAIGKSGFGMPNPAAFYCTAHGYKYENAKTGGAISACHFPDGNKCSAWEFLAGRCGASYTKCKQTGGVVKTLTNNCPYSQACAVCEYPDGSTIHVTQLMGIEEVTRGIRTAVLPLQKVGQVQRTSLPSAFDWRNKDGQNWLTEVKNQGNCGSCWAFSAVGAVEAQYNISRRVPDSGFDLSEEFLVSGCGSQIGSCCGGWHTTALDYIKDNGIPDEMCFPYADSACSCTGGACVAETVLLRGSSQRSESILASLKIFRDTVLEKKYVDLYYKHSAFLKEILISNPILLLRTSKILVKYFPAIKALIRAGEDVRLGREGVEEIIGFVEEIERQVAETGQRRPGQEYAEIISLLTQLKEQMGLFREMTVTEAFRESIYNRHNGVAYLSSSPGKATLISPSGTITTSTPNYAWYPVVNATSYLLLVNDSSAINKIETWYTSVQAGCSSGTGTCTVTPSVSLTAGDAQWWIQTRNDQGLGPLSDPMNFTVQPQITCSCSYNSNNTGEICSNTTCSNRCANYGSRLIRALEVGPVTPDQIKNKLIEAGPLSVAMGVGTDVGGSFDANGIYHCTDNKTLNHAVIIVGYDDARSAWIVKNSWGPEWNNEHNGGGYFYVGYEQCGIDTSEYMYYVKGVAGLSGCSYSINPQAASFGSNGGAGSVAVMAQSGCSWTAISNTSWITITSGGSGIASGTVVYTVSTNTSATSRSGTLTIAGKLFTITQSGASPNPLPDLVVTRFTGPTTGVIGGEVDGTSMTVSNQGTAAAGPFRVAYFISTDMNITTSDTYTNWICNVTSGLAPNASFACTGKVGIPTTISAGTYYLGAIADDLNQVVESNENNNSRVGDTGPILLTSQSARTQVPINLLSGGAGTIMTRGGSNLQAGYATVTLDAAKNADDHSAVGNVPYGTVAFSLKQSGMVVSEVVIPATPPSTAFRIFIDYRSNLSNGLSTDTGFAIVNVSTMTANITYQLRDYSGSLIALGHSQMSGGTHTALFIDQLNQVANDFSLPPNFSAGIGFASLDILSTQPISVVALRQTTNQRREALLTSTPVIDLTKPVSYSTLHFPQIVDGGGYKTSLIEMNTSNVVLTPHIYLYDNYGNPLAVRQIGDSNSYSGFYCTIRPSGFCLLLTDGSPTTVHAGSARVVPSSGEPAPAVAALFGYTVPSSNVLVSESGIPSASPTDHVRIYVDRSKEHNTGLAVAAPSAQPMNLTLKAYQSDGKTFVGSGSINLPGNGHDAKFANELIPSLQDGFTGVIDISSSLPFVALTMRSLTNARGDFLLTTFPVADFNQLAPTPICFPQVVDGGGYQTQVVLIGLGSSVNSTVNFFGDNGSALAIGKKPDEVKARSDTSGVGHTTFDRQGPIEGHR